MRETLEQDNGARDRPDVDGSSLSYSLESAQDIRSKGVIDHAPSGLHSLIYSYDELILDASATCGT